MFFFWEKLSEEGVMFPTFSLYEDVGDASVYVVHVNSCFCVLMNETGCLLSFWSFYADTDGHVSYLCYLLYFVSKFLAQCSLFMGLFNVF
jgi:hypothetical protein